MAIRKDLGIATAYGYAVSKGYTGTEEEFAELMASYASVGQTAIQAAESASASATASARSAAQSAQSATNASNSATAASTSATNAAGSATDAGTEALKAEGVTLGKQNGVDVGSDSPYYHANAKYYSEQAQATYDQAVAVKNSIPQDYTALSADVDNIKADLNEFTEWVTDGEEKIQIIKASTLERGSIADGNNVASNSRVRSITFLDPKYKKISAINEYKVTLVFWDSNDNYVGYLSTSKTVVNSGTGGYFQEINLSAYSDYKYRIIVRKGTGSDVITVDNTYENVLLTVDGFVDNTLTVEGKPADAKTTGDAIHALDDSIDELSDEFNSAIGYSIDALLENGSFTDGNKTDSNNRVRTKDCIPHYISIITADDTISIHAIAWDKNGYIGYLVSRGRFSKTGTGLYVQELNLEEIYSEHPDYELALLFRNKNRIYAALSPEDVVNHYTLDVDGNIFDKLDNIEQRVEAIEEKKDSSARPTLIDSYETFFVDNKECTIFNSYKAKGLHVYKGQLHCHTNQSDGVWSPTTLVNNYINAGYDFITITDHNTVTLEPSHNDGIVWLCNSYEDTKNVSGGQHCNVFNTDETYNVASIYRTTNTPEMIIDHFVKNGQSVTCYNHPEYPTVYASDETLENLPEGFSFMEVWNGTIQCTLGEVTAAADLPSEARYGDMYDVTSESAKYINKSKTRTAPDWQVADASSYPEGNLDRGYRIALDNGYKVFCLAVDDCHFDSSFNYAWINVYASQKTKEDIWNALLSGRFYASSGVTYKDVSCKNGVFKVEIEPVDGETYTTYFYGEGNAILKSVTGTTASYNLTGSEKYVRAMTVSSKNLQCKAWTNPIWIISAKKQYTFDN